MIEKVKAVFLWSKSAGETIGALVSLIGLPAAVVSGIAYSQEIDDYLSVPKVLLEFDNVSLRCAYAFRDQERLLKYSAGDNAVFVEVCDEAPLSVSFLARLTNTDRIGREVQSVFVELFLPGASSKIDLKLTREVEHLVAGLVETNVRRPWTTTALAAGQTIDKEVWFEPADSNRNRIPYQEFRLDMTESESSYSGQIATIEVYARVSGSEPISLRRCSLSFKPDALTRFKSKPAHRQLQFTATCN